MTITFIPTCYCIGGIRIRLYVHAIIFLSLLSGFNSCETWKIDPVVEKWPMTTGSEWHYQQTYYLFKFASDSSDVITDSDTIQNLYKLWVLKDTVLNDTLALTVFELAEEDSLTWMWRQYYLLDEEGLKLYAYLPNPGPFSFRKSKAVFNNHFPLLTEQGPETKLLYPGDKLIYLDPPRLSIQLPLKEDSYWTCQEKAPYQFRIDKKVTGTDLIQAGGNEYACFRVDWVYFDYIVDTDILVTEWIAEEGLIKRVVKIPRTDITDINGEDIYSGQFAEVLQLVDVNIK